MFIKQNVKLFLIDIFSSPNFLDKMDKNG